MRKIKIVVSDCHLSAGRFFEGKHNPYEDFLFDDEMVDLITYFSTGKYGDAIDEVELVLAGDYLDFLNVPVQGEFEDAITEETALSKAEAIFAGHPKVMTAIREFAAKRGKRVSYLIGNHDADLIFQKVRERITREFDPEGRYPSPVVSVIGDRDRISYPEDGIEIRHGNQFEAGSQLDFARPILKAHRDQPVLNLPWSSIYVLKIVNRLKQEREYLDKIRPIKVFVLFGLIIDPLFTIKFLFLSIFYFLHTRLVWSKRRRNRLKETFGILKQETRFFLDLEKEARQLLDQRPEIKTIVMGHTHRPMNKVYPDGRQYINTGTWTRMINLDWRYLGTQIRRTFAYIDIEDGQIKSELRQWVGEHSPHQTFDG